MKWTEWVSDRGIEPELRKRRKVLLDEVAKANGKDSVDELLNDIWLDKLTPYEASRTFRDSMIDEGLRAGTIAQSRSMLSEFWLSVLGDENFRREKFEREVKFKNTGTEIEKLAPTKEELKHLLAMATPKERALLAVLAGTGMRINEALSRKLSDIKPGANGKPYYRIELPKAVTKMNYKRWIPLTAETVEWIKNAHEGEKSEWIFPGEVPGKKPKGKIPKEGKRRERAEQTHLTDVSAWRTIKFLFRRGGLVDTEAEDGKKIYSPHSMRKFAENTMLACGLPDKFTGAIIGHAGELGKAYQDEQDNEVTERWFEVCNDRMTWLQPVEVIKHDLAQDKKVQDLEAKLNLLLNAVAAKLAPHEGHSPTEQLAALQKLL
jgi:integrase